MKVKRHILEDGSLEPWLQWHIRTYHLAGKMIEHHSFNVLEKLSDMKRSWAALIANLGKQTSETHPLKSLAAWRCKFWWLDHQLYNDLNWDAVRHYARQGRPKRWEEQFSSNWMLALFQAS